MGRSIGKRDGTARKLVFWLMLGLGGLQARAQALAAATGPGNYSAVGGAVSVFQADYGKRDLGGVVMYADVQPTWRWGAEGEARYLRLHTSEDVTETNYLIGPRFTVRSRGVQPYVKFLAGTGKLSFPFHYAEGRYFAMAPGGGMEKAVSAAIAVRVDFEYQMWPGFQASAPLRPYGLSTGVSWRFNAADRAPHGLRH